MSDQMPMDYMLPPSDWTTPEVLPDLRGTGHTACDLETKDDGISSGRGSGWAYNAGYITGVAIASEKGSCYAPIKHPDSVCHDEDAVRRWTRDHTHAIGDRVVMQNSPYDIGWLGTQWDIEPPPLLDDTQIMAYLLDENWFQYDLDSICSYYGVQGKDTKLLKMAADAYGCDPKAEMWKIPARYVGPYGEQDAVATLRVAAVMRRLLEEQGLTDAYQLECDLIPMIVAMRRRGIRIDTKRAPEVRDLLTGRRDEALRVLDDKLTIGRPLSFKDINSSDFLRRLFDDENIPYSRTAIGNPSFKSEEIEKIDHWLPQQVVLARKANDAGEKFVGNYIMNFTHLGRIHAEAKSTKTKTTRFAYSDPPLQQMPGREPEISLLVRGLFLPEEGEIWGAHDYSQQEFRLMVHFAHLCGMAGVSGAHQMYHDDPSTDFHDLAAELTKLPRRRAKDVNFAKAFGAGKHKFALMTGMTIEDAETTMDQYDEELPFISRLSEFCQNRADRRGYIRLLDGARRHFDRWEPRWTDYKKVRAAQAINPNIKINPCSREEAQDRIWDRDHPWTGKLRRAFTHQSMNSLIQGSAARQTKLCMRECWREGILPLIQMHDELGFSHGRDETGRREGLRVQEIMRDTVKLEVPVMVDSEYGVTWGRAKKFSKEKGDSVDYGATFEEAVRC